MEALNGIVRLFNLRHFVLDCLVLVEDLLVLSIADVVGWLV